HPVVELEVAGQAQSPQRPALDMAVPEIDVIAAERVLEDPRAHRVTRGERSGPHHAPACGRPSWRRNPGENSPVATCSAAPVMVNAPSPASAISSSPPGISTRTRLSTRPRARAALAAAELLLPEASV